MPVCQACMHRSPSSIQPLYGPTLRRFFWQAQSLAFQNSAGANQTDTTNRARNRTILFSRAASSSSPPPGVLARTSQALTLLHKTRSFLPRALGHGESTDSLGFWNRTLCEISDELSSKATAEAKIRIVVGGVDRWSEPQPMITALLQEPLTSPVLCNDAIQDRWKDRKGLKCLAIESSSSNHDSEPGVLRTASSWFQRFSIPIRITELVPPSTDRSISSSSGQPDLIHPMLLKADIPIILINTMTTSLSSLLKYTSLFRNPNAIILLMPNPTSPNLAQHLRFLLTQADIQPADRHESEANNPFAAKVLFVNPELALQALDALGADPKDPRNILEYQKNFMESNINHVNAAITDILDKFKANTAILRTETARTLTGLAFKACRDSIKQAEWDIDVVCAQVSELRGKVEVARARVRGEVLGTDGSDEVQKAMEEAKKGMKLVMDNLTWWKMVWRVDDLAVIVGNAAQRVWCNDLEDKLILHTGRLSALQGSLTSSATLLPPLLPSPVLQNTLAQLSSSPSYTLQTSTLITPLRTRLDQLISYPTTRLHLAGQSALLGILGRVGGTGIAIYLLGVWSGIGIAGASGPGTAAGILALSLLVGVRWSMGKWERAKKRWWGDWSRLGEGLRRDLEATLDRTMNEKVVIVADRAAEGMDALVRKRREELEGVKEKLEELEKELVKMEPPR